MNIADIGKESYEIAKAKGGYGTPMDRDMATKILLCHAELSEAFEELRKGFAVDELYMSGEGQADKPEGVPAEIADVIITLLGACHFYDVPIEEAITQKLAYNRTRSYRHGGKKL